ncbi:MAG: sulfite exporter TauE/SafE family protein [Promethearchaeota archaeon]
MFDLGIIEIFLLIGIGALVGLSISFVGQTGQGVVLPTVLLITGDVFLAIAINLLNDFITVSLVSIKYIRRKEFHIRQDILIIILISIGVSFVGVLILMTTALGNIYGWFIPLFIILLGLSFMKKGFPTTESIRNMVKKFNKRFKGSKEKNFNEKSMRNDNNADPDKENEDDINGFIKKGSKLFYILAIFFGIFIGINSGLFGASSGLIFVLVLVILYGFPLKRGVGTALILSMIVTFCSFVFYEILGFTIKNTIFFNIEISFYLALGSVIVGIIASSYVQKLPAKTMGRLIGLIIAILGAISLIFYLIKI